MSYMAAEVGSGPKLGKKVPRKCALLGDARFPLIGRLKSTF